MPEYAKETTVSVAKTKAEIEAVLSRYGADTFSQGWNREAAAIYFRIEGRCVKIILPLPDRNDKEFTHVFTRGNLKERTADVAEKAWEQACRQRWRALLLVIKAKLEAVDCGISTIEREFLSDVVLPNGLTIGEWIEPQMERIYLEGKMPPMLLLTAGE